MRGVQVLQAHQSGQGGGVRQAVADVERFQCGAGQLVELRAVGEQVLAERLVEQRLDEVLLSCRSHDVRAVRAGAVAHAGVLRGLGAVEVLHAALQVQAGIGVLSNGIQMSTPPSASIMLLRPWKSTTTTSWMSRPVSAFTAFTVQPAADARSPP